MASRRKTSAAPATVPAPQNSEGQPPAAASGQDAGSNVVAVTAQPEPVVGAQALGSAAFGQAAPSAETGEVKGADAAAAPDTGIVEQRRRFLVYSPIRFNKCLYPQGDFIALTEEEHEPLYTAGALVSEWDDGISMPE